MRSPNNKRGQIAIFIALIFQVIFVFLAMTINIGLVVHDKINLQNSIDLGAYYAAERQAEILNAIAHSNYQIRQSWKLLAFRLRYIGDSDRNGHPANNLLKEEFVEDPIRALGAPTVCAASSKWFNGGEGQNLCQKASAVYPPIAIMPNLAPFNPINALVINISNTLKKGAENNCKNYGVQDWALAMRWYTAFRLDVGNRKKVIRKLADLLARPDDIKSLTGESVLDGVRMTIRKNLTRANLQTFKDSDVQMFNSMGHPGIRSRQDWLRDIPIFPLIYYSDIEKPCSVVSKRLDLQTPYFYNNDPQLKARIDPDGSFEKLRFDTLNVEDATKASIGVEKNPWFLTYVGVKAVTKTRKPFAPFGKPVEMTARAFAQPFGGRIGPWFKNNWFPGDSKSSGLSVDRLLPEEPADNGLYKATANSVPNYSRYPGDSLGLSSIHALSLFNRLARVHLKSPLPYSHSYYINLIQDLDVGYGDVLAWTLDPREAQGVLDQKDLNPAGPWVRQMEIAAIAPDLFDAAYYSIDSDFLNNYINKTANIFGQGVRLRSDLGAHAGDINIPFDVNKQIRTANISVGLTGQNYYQIQDRDHLLTGWAPNAAFDFEFPEKWFGHCLREGAIAVPGKCAVGGRTGYSVKIISYDYLMSDKFHFSPESGNAPIRNPPTNF